MFGGTDRRRPRRRHPAPGRATSTSSALRQHDAGRTSASSTSASRAASAWPAWRASRSASGSPSSARCRPSSASRLPGGILLEPTTGLTINNFSAGVEFFKTLPSIEDPFALRGNDFALPTAQTADEWLNGLQRQVAAQAKAIAADPCQGRLPGRLHLADDDHRLGQDLLDLHLPAGLQRPGDRQDLHRRQVPDRRQAQLRRRPGLDQRPPLRRPLEDRQRLGDGAVPRRRARPGAAADDLRQAQDGLPQPVGRGDRVRRRQPAAGHARLDEADRHRRLPGARGRLGRSQHDRHAQLLRRRLLGRRPAPTSTTARSSTATRPADHADRHRPDRHRRQPDAADRRRRSPASTASRYLAADGRQHRHQVAARRRES